MTKLPAVSTPTPYTTQKIALAKISANPANPRKHFDEDELAALAASIAVQGLLQAPAVRPARAGGVSIPGVFILIWGERRTRAAKLVRPPIEDIECRVYDVDEVKAAELALVENDQRVDLTPLERAAGYQELHKKHGLSYDAIADQVKKSRSSVYETVGLLGLDAEVKRAIAAEDLSASHAAVIAGLPKELHEQALDYALHGPHGDGPLSLREFKELIATEFMLDLAKAAFDTKDATLVPKAGACVTCPKRTGFGQMDLLAEKGKKVLDLCKDKPCFGSKADAQLGRLAKTGTKVLSKEEAEEVFPDESGDFISHRSDYVRADQKEEGSKKTFGEQVEAAKHVMAKVPGSGEIVELVPRSALPKPEKSPAAERREKDPEEAKREKEHKARGAVQVALIDEMSRSKDVELGTDLFLRAIAKGIGRSVQSEPSKQLCKRLGLDPQPGGDFREMLWEHIDTLGQAQLRRTVLQLAFADSVPDFMYSGGLDETLLAGAKMLRVDADKVEAAVRKELKEEASEKTASKKAGAELAVKIAKVKKSKLTPHQQAALISKMKGNVEAKAKPVVEKVATKKLAAAAKKSAKKAPKAKAKKKAAKR